MSHISKILLATFAILICSKANCQTHGTFVGDPEGKLIGSEWFLLTKDFQYQDPDGIRWRVSAPFRTDGASIPRLFWTIIGSPLIGNYRYAAIVHDYFCRRRYPTSEMVHKTFYNGMLAKGVSRSKAWIMYEAVKRFGPHWKDPSLSAECKPGKMFKPRLCLMNEDGGGGTALTPTNELNSRNLRKFLQDIKAAGFTREANELNAHPAVRRLLAD